MAIDRKTKQIIRAKNFGDAWRIKTSDQLEQAIERTGHNTNLLSNFTNTNYLVYYKYKKD